MKKIFSLLLLITIAHCNSVFSMEEGNTSPVRQEMTREKKEQKSKRVFTLSYGVWGSIFCRMPQIYDVVGIPVNPEKKIDKTCGFSLPCLPSVSVGLGNLTKKSDDKNSSTKTAKEKCKSLNDLKKNS